MVWSMALAEDIHRVCSCSGLPGKRVEKGEWPWYLTHTHLFHWDNLLCQHCSRCPPVPVMSGHSSHCWHRYTVWWFDNIIQCHVRGQLTGVFCISDFHKWDRSLSHWMKIVNWKWITNSNFMVVNYAYRFTLMCLSGGHCIASTATCNSTGQVGLLLTRGCMSASLFYTRPRAITRAAKRIGGPRANTKSGPPENELCEGPRTNCSYCPSPLSAALAITTRGHS